MAADHKDKAEPEHKAHAKAHAPADGITIGSLVRVRARPATSTEPARLPSDVVYRVKDVSHDKGRLFASVENFPDPSAGVFGSYHLEDLEAAPAAELPEGPGGHPAPTEEQRKAAEAALAQRRKVDEDAARAVEAENKRAADLAAAQRAELKKTRGHHE